MQQGVGFIPFQSKKFELLGFWRHTHVACGVSKSEGGGAVAVAIRMWRKAARPKGMLRANRKGIGESHVERVREWRVRRSVHVVSAANDFQRFHGFMFGFCISALFFFGVFFPLLSLLRTRRESKFQILHEWKQRSLVKALGQILEELGIAPRGRQK
jgi:hypothetical protein